MFSPLYARALIVAGQEDHGHTKSSNFSGDRNAIDGSTQTNVDQRQIGGLPDAFRQGFFCGADGAGNLNADFMEN
jgi:hypothetical protein